MNEGIADKKNTLTPLNAPIFASFIEIGDEPQMLSSKVGELYIELQFMRSGQVGCKDSWRRCAVDEIFGRIDKASWVLFISL